MDFDSLFGIASNMAMVGWLLLIFVPYWKYTKPIVQYGLIGILLSFLYAYLVFFAPGGSMDLSSFGSLVGSWEVGDAQKRGINRWFLVPCLLATFMLGPVGLLLYIGLRALMTKKVTHENFGLAS